MRQRFRICLILAVCLLAPAQRAFGWNAIGHMAVAYVAYQKLTVQQKARATELLKLNPSYGQWLSYIPAGTSDADRDTYIFMMAATWPDQIKAQTSGYANDGNVAPDTPEASANTGYDDKVMHKYWHYTDHPYSVPAGMTLPAIPKVNAQTEIALLRAAIATDESDAVKSYDLVWLLHLVGDIHQPLHCTTRVTAATAQGDQGGNAVVLVGKPNELHAYWDNLLGTGSTQDFAKAVAAAKKLAAASPSAAAKTHESVWVKESFAMAKRSVYKAPIGDGTGPYTIDPTSKYAKSALALGKKRVALAGERLGNLINVELK